MHKGGYGVGLWKSIRKEWTNLICSSSFVVGNGRRMKFWKDKWCGEEPLCVSYPSLFVLAISKKAWVVDIGFKQGRELNLCFSRPLND